MLDYEQLIGFINEYNAHYRELLRFETEKFSLIAHDNVNELGKSLSSEQALIMKSGSFEKKRCDILSGENGKSFPDIIKASPERYRSQLTDGYNELRKLVFQIKRINDNARDIVSQRLSVLEGAKSNGFVNSYDGGGKKLRTEKSPTLDKDI